jgi:peptidyl-prolyl cis-trans isomerase A (cyclophilin A)
MANAMGGSPPVPEKNYAVIETSQGTIVCQLFPASAPKTVDNFAGLATGEKEWLNPKTHKLTHQPLYNGTIFHRVIPDFMIQGGDPLGIGVGGPGYRFEDEIDRNLKFDQPGKLAMANAGPNTNGSQFFITVAPTPWLNGKHTIFGQVIQGQEVVDKISKLPRDERDRPLEPVVIKQIQILEKFDKK